MDRVKHLHSHWDLVPSHHGHRPFGCRLSREPFRALRIWGFDERIPLTLGDGLLHDVELGLEQILGGLFGEVVLHNQGLVELDEAAVV